MPVKEYSIQQLFKLFHRLDRLKESDRSMVHNKFLGCLTIQLKDPKVWAELEKYISEYESQQIPIDLPLTDDLLEIVKKAETKSLTRV